eukprot:jgi/Botrbrau1/19501/Bobra.0035s0003.1
MHLHLRGSWIGTACFTSCNQRSLWRKTFERTRQSRWGSRPQGSRKFTNPPLLGSSDAQNRLSNMSGAKAFTGSSVESLRAWLENSGLCTKAYGTGKAKGLDNLLTEVQRGESVLINNGNKPLRMVRVLVAEIVNAANQVLVEDWQQLPSGAVRQRNRCLSEKMLAAESWKSAVHRGVVEELGSLLGTSPSYSVDPASLRTWTRTSKSISYPELESVYELYKVRMSVAGLPETDFQTEEVEAGGTLLHCWVWRDISPEDVLEGELEGDEGQSQRHGNS